MAKRYIVDLSNLEKAQRKAAFDLIDRFSFLTGEIYGENGLEGADVIWDASEDFPTSPVFPAGCPYWEVK